MNKRKFSDTIKFGAHLSLGDPGCLNEIINDCQINSIQIFISNPRSFNPVFSDKSRENLKKLIAAGINVCAHMPYVVNLASRDESLRKKSVEHVIAAVKASSELSLCYYVVHPGSGPYEIFLDSARALTAGTSGCKTGLLIENTEGSGNKLMAGFDLIEKFIADIEGRIGFCWDTAHAFGAGADTLKMPKAIKKLVRLVHLNDSKMPFASKKDRHEGFSLGLIGRANIEKILNMFGISPIYIIEREGREATFDDLQFIRRALSN